MNKCLKLLVFFLVTQMGAQKLNFKTILEDDISIRAIQIWKGKVYYAGTNSKFGYVDMDKPDQRHQIRLDEKPLQFRTLAQDKRFFYCINIESPAQFFKIDKKDLSPEIIHTDSLKSAFYDALYRDEKLFYTFSDPDIDLKNRYFAFEFKDEKFIKYKINSPDLVEEEAAFAASNSNIASSKNWVWLATGGKKSRIFRLNKKTLKMEVIETPIIQGTASQGIYSIDFYGDSFGIAVGGDYTKQEESINNIATTTDAGKTWQVQASGKNAGYMTCVKIRPGSRGKEILAIGDQHISYSNDFGKTWRKISDEKGLFICEWIDKKTIVFAGKNRIVAASFSE